VEELMRGLAMVTGTLLAFVGLLSAQSSQLSGTVRDVTGAVLPGVTVTLTGPALEKPLTTTTSARGTYSFGDLPADEGYVVTFSLVCFNTQTVRKVTIAADKKAAVDSRMRVGTCADDIVPRYRGGIVPISTP
jgi:Carboxypeptidase regulatory-like domain